MCGFDRLPHKMPDFLCGLSTFRAKVGKQKITVSRVTEFRAT
ncbi:hypothetical protein [Vibrio vulnificus YJ016]|uniref:Uncharacterized protein n=1 Tax=Vibrio vulnificus (strain YJ016) TaxID=196600 RepID=Q7MJH9_VIBVY|nr:hypothetical protein [Vibrio vulnificus YJ016]